MVDDHADEALGQLVHFLSDQGHVGEDRIQRHAGFAELLAGVVDARVGNAQAHAFGNDVAQLDRLGHHVRGNVFAEVIQQVLVVQIGRHHRVLPGGDRHLQTENIVELAALFPGAEQVTDIVQGVTAFQQGTDDFQASQVNVGVDTRTAAFFRRRQDAAVLVGTYVTHCRAALAGQFVNGVFLVIAGFCRGVLCVSLGVFLQAAQYRCGVTVTGFHGCDDSPVFALVLEQSMRYATGITLHAKTRDRSEWSVWVLAAQRVSHPVARAVGVVGAALEPRTGYGGSSLKLGFASQARLLQLRCS